MTDIILARHGETEWNAKEIFRGRADIGLSDTGARQVELLAGYLSQVEVTAIYSSPLRRAVETAEAIAHHHGLNVKVAPELIDFDYGEWQGLPHDEVRNSYKELYAGWLSSPQRVRMPGGESLDDVRKRAFAIVRHIISRYQGTVVLVSHRVVNKVLICALLGLGNSHFWNIRQDICGLTTFTYENNRFILTGHNNTSFLEPVRKAPLSDF